MARRGKYDQPDDTEKSKSQLKRESTALQQLGQELAELGESRLESLPLPEDLREAVRELRQMTSHEARRRQSQYIGRLMREIDPEPLREAMEEIRDGARRQARDFNRVEAWRDRLVAGEDGVEEEIMAACPDADRQRLLQLARTARREAAKGTPPHASRKLFRYLRELAAGVAGTGAEGGEAGADGWEASEPEDDE